MPGTADWVQAPDSQNAEYRRLTELARTKLQESFVITSAVPSVSAFARYGSRARGICVHHMFLPGR